MKKLIYTGKILIILSLVILQSCKKDSKVDFPKQASSNGTFPDFSYRTPTISNISDADGILLAVQAHNYHIVTISPVEQDYEYGMAQFTNSNGNFSSLTDADSVWVNSTNCDKSTSFSYLSSALTYSLGFSGNISWKVKGAGAVPGMTFSTSGGNPTYGYSFAKWDVAWIPIYPRTLIAPTPVILPIATHADTLRWLHDIVLFKNDSVTHRTDSIYNLTTQYTIPIRNYVANADTVVIVMNDGLGFNYERKVLATDSLAYFSPNSFSGFPGFSLSALTIQVNLLKYNSTIIGTKKYYFIKMGSYIKYLKTS